MTGGSLPGMTWRQIMTYAHAGIDLKPIPGVEGTQPARPAAVVASAAPTAEPIQRPAVLSKKAAEVLVRIERLMEDAVREPVAGRPISEAPRAALPLPVAAAEQRQSAVRGN
jgi:penicillin-binding protein 1A